MNTPTLTTCCRRASEALCPKRTQPPSLPPVFEKALTTATCVCRPLVKGFPFLTSTAICFTSRGCKQPIQSCTNEDTGCVLVISIWDAKSTYLQSSSHAVTPLFHGLIPWSLHDRPQNLFPPQTCSRLAATLTVRVQTLFNHTVLADFFHHAVPSPSFPTWELRYLNTIVRVCVVLMFFYCLFLCVRPI